MNTNILTSGIANFLYSCSSFSLWIQTLACTLTLIVGECLIYTKKILIVINCGKITEIMTHFLFLGVLVLSNPPEGFVKFVRTLTDNHQKLTLDY